MLPHEDHIFIKASHRASSFLQPLAWEEEEETAALFSPFALLPIAACLTYLAPACVAAQMGRLWHVFIFSVMTILGTAQQACVAGSQLQLGGYMICSHATREVVQYASTSWAHFCFLQVCFIVLGLEDPWLHRGKNKGLAARIGEVPFDVLLFARALPLVALLYGSGVADESRFDDPPNSTWKQQAIRDSHILLIGSVAWWFGSQARRAQALDILLRVRYWARIALRLLLPFGLLLPVAFACGAPGWRVLQAARHAGFSAIACGVCSDVFRGKVDLSDRSSENWLIISWMPLVIGLMFLGTGVTALFVDTASCGMSHMQCHPGKQWPTFPIVSVLPGGRFVLSIMGPFLLLATAAMVWIIDSCPLERAVSQVESLPLQFQMSLERRFGWLSYVLTRKNKKKCRWLGCRCLIIAVFLGTCVALCIEDGPLRNVLHLTIMGPFVLALLLGISFCTASASSSTTIAVFRLLVTCVIITDLLSLLVVSILSTPDLHVPKFYLPHPALRAVFEYALVCLAAIWPMTWIEDARAVRDPWSIQQGTDASSL